MNDMLFEVERQDSPRLAWMKKHAIRTHHTPGMEDELPWIAWHGANHGPDGIPLNPSRCGYGDTEADAIADLARRIGIHLWNGS